MFSFSASPMLEVTSTPSFGASTAFVEGATGAQGGGHEERSLLARHTAHDHIGLTVLNRVVLLR